MIPINTMEDYSTLIYVIFMYIDDVFNLISFFHFINRNHHITARISIIPASCPNPTAIEYL